jgi:phosphopantothenoylcysteine decarboxylase/phosphopantothenate--cysteine ligase
MSATDAAGTLLELAGRHIVLGLSGGIACYKSAELVRELTKAGATVQVVMSEAAEHFITAVTMQALSNRPVATSQWDAREPNNMAHINLTRSADAVLIAPASADLMAKLAQGRADDLLSLMCLARPIERCPLLVAPAMNREMWAHPATQRNAAQLRADGTRVLGPASGDQACGEIGDGRMLEPEELLAELIALFQPKVLQGRSVLITAGPTFEPIDPVRGLTNRSSGKMGYRIAEAAWERGAEVVLISGPVALPAPVGPLVRRVESTTELEAAVRAELPSTDVLVMAAAPADFRPSDPSDSKRSRTDGALAIPMEPTGDILHATREARKPGSVIVGFALETGDALAKGRAKLERKDLDLIVVNDALEPGAGFEHETNRVALMGRDGTPQILPLQSKREVAEAILDAVERHLG